MRRVTTNVPTVQQQKLLDLAKPRLAAVETTSTVTIAIPAEPSPRWHLFAALAAVYVIWSSTYLGMKIAMATFPPIVLGTMRFLLAGSILLAIHLVRGGARPTRQQVLAAAPVGILLFVVGNGFIALAQHEVASGVAAIVASTTPLWAALLAPLFGERAQAAEWIGVVLGTIGVALLGAHADLGSNWLLTVGLLLSPVGWAVGSMLSRKRPSAPGLAGPGLNMLWGGLGMAVMAPLIGERWPASIPAEAWGVFAYLVVFGSLIGFTAFTWLLKNTRPSLALSYSYVNPAIAVLLGVVVGHEPLHETTIAATAILVIAVAVVVRAAIARRPQAGPRAAR